MTRILPVFACLVGLLGPRGLAGQGVEEILSFDVQIDVQPGGLMVVTEEITVRALGREIRRGIYRDFPTSFPRQIGLGRIEAPFSVHSVTRDGAAEPYSLQSTGGPAGRGGMRIRIGDADGVLDPGIYRYTIEYETQRWVSSFAGPRRSATHSSRSWSPVPCGKRCPGTTTMRSASTRPASSRRSEPDCRALCPRRRARQAPVVEVEGEGAPREAVGGAEV